MAEVHAWVPVGQEKSTSMNQCSVSDGRPQPEAEEPAKRILPFKKLQILQTAALQSSQFPHVDLISILWVSLDERELPMCDFIKFASYK